MACIYDVHTRSSKDSYTYPIIFTLTATYRLSWEVYWPRESFASRRTRTPLRTFSVIMREFSSIIIAKTSVTPQFRWSSVKRIIFNSRLLTAVIDNSVILPCNYLIISYNIYYKIYKYKFISVSVWRYYVKTYFMICNIKQIWFMSRIVVIIYIAIIRCVIRIIVFALFDDIRTSDLSSLTQSDCNAENNTVIRHLS